MFINGVEKLKYVFCVDAVTSEGTLLAPKLCVGETLEGLRVGV